MGVENLVRAADLAQAAGISAQQIRNYVDRVYSDFELRARVVALLRRGNYPFPIVHAVLREMRSAGSTERVRAELAKREQDLHGRSLRRLRASAALYAYLDHQLCTQLCT